LSDTKNEGQKYAFNGYLIIEKKENCEGKVRKELCYKTGIIYHQRQY